MRLPPGHLRETKDGVYFFSLSGTVYKVDTAAFGSKDGTGDR